MATTSSHLATAHLTATTGNAATSSSGSFTPTSAGTWCFSAVYGGDSIYTGSADNTSSTNLDADECVLVTPSPSTTATFISSARLTLGPMHSAYDTVTVTGNVVGGAPTGSVTFYVCHTSIAATFTPGPCLASGTPEDAAVPLLTGAGASSAASSRSSSRTRWARGASRLSTPAARPTRPSADNTSSATRTAASASWSTRPRVTPSPAPPTPRRGPGFSFSVPGHDVGDPDPDDQEDGKAAQGRAPREQPQRHGDTSRVSPV